MRLALTAVSFAALTLVAACNQPMDPERAAQYCEERARAAMGPQGGVSLAVNSQTGPSMGLSISVSDDYLKGRDPNRVYEDCVIERTGAMPYRAPVLY